MIGLNITMPTTCLDCPCLHTFSIAEKRPLVIISINDLKNSIDWMNFQKPEWCPWVEIKDGEQV